MASIYLVTDADAGARTHRLVQRWHERAPAAPAGSALWLGPSRRALASGAQLTPAATLQDCADTVVHTLEPAAQPLANAQRRVLLEGLLFELHARGQLPHLHGILETRGFVDAVLGLLSTWKQQAFAPAELQHSLPGSMLRHWALIYRTYHEALKQQSLYDCEGRIWHAATLLRAQPAQRVFPQLCAVFVDGFAGWTRAQEDFLLALASHVEELWLSLPNEDDSRTELFAPSRRSLLRFMDRGATLLLQHAVSQARPRGLEHVRAQLFRSPQDVERGSDATGLLLLEGPGAVGEARLVAREVYQLLRTGVRADDILLVVREVPPYADLVREVCAEYGIPLDAEGGEPLSKCPVVALLLRLARLADDDYPFAQVTALLRSNYFQPAWPEYRAAPEVATQSEALLRLLGTPRGRDAYLAAVARWAEQMPPALDDEQAEASRRLRTHQLARTAQAFLQRFLHTWDDAPQHAPLAAHIAWLRWLAEELGLSAAAAATPRDGAALQRFWEALAAWERLEQHRKTPLERGRFQGLLFALASEASLARTPRGPGRVRLLSAPLARAVQAPHIFLMGLAERGFPNLTPSDALLDEPERQAFRDAGAHLPSSSELLEEEMLLFYQIVSAASVRLVLSYPALDEKGQPLLPSTFLAAVLACFTPDAVPRVRRQLLIEGMASDTPLSLAEYRVQAAHVRGVAGARWPLPADVGANLDDAWALAQARFDARDFTVYDGLLHEPRLCAAVAKQFGPERILSPTALEQYIACPFKFFLGAVLRLEVLPEPAEDIESTERGLAFHRALARLHRERRTQGKHGPDAAMEAHVRQHLEVAMHECATHGSAAAQALWRLEGQRLQKQAARYGMHWQKFLAPWLKEKCPPQPELFEVGFGLPPAPEETMAGPLVIVHGEVEVRISGRIDRVDVAELPDGAGVGYWIIDYKTGHSGYYTGSDLREFRKLQLTLYALATEQVLLAGRNARPLGLAYWLVLDEGPKIVMPAGKKVEAWYQEASAWPRVRQTLQQWVIELVARIRRGEFPLQPRSEQCTQMCDFAQICRISQSRAVVAQKSWRLELPVV